MGGRWKQFGIGFSCFIVLILVSGFRVCWSLDDEGLVLVAFRGRINSDPFGALENWNSNDDDHCSWSGVLCVDGEVQMLDMTGLSLEGELAPELGRLTHLKSLVLRNNCFSGTIPKEIGELMELELLDLRGNKLTGRIPVEIGRMLSLKRLLLSDNRFEGSIPLDPDRLERLSDFQFDEYLASSGVLVTACVNRKLRHCSPDRSMFFLGSIWQGNSNHLNRADSLLIPIKGALNHYVKTLAVPLFRFKKDSLCTHGYSSSANMPSSSEAQSAQKFVSFARRKLLEEASNLAAAPSGESPSAQIISLPMTRSSGAFPAVPKEKKKSHPPSPLPVPATPHNTLNPDGHHPLYPTTYHGKPSNLPSPDGSQHMWKYVIIAGGGAVLLIVVAAMLCMCRSKAVSTIGPWKTGLSGQLQKAFITGVPKLNRSELETACEDFSNIISTIDGCTVYKGTLSSGVEIAVASTTVSSHKEWTKSAEMTYRKKIDTLSRVNHKNFVNLIGFCEENEPFVRMMVFEYAPNGTLFEHLHVKEVEHLDWNARMRIIMGTSYCLQYMHHDLNPPVAHPNLSSTSIYLTDDYAAKIAEFGFWSTIKSKNKIEDDKENSELPPSADPETNVYSFGILLLEIISGKLQYSEEQGSLVNWAAEYLNEKRSISYMIDPSLKSFKNNELDLICEVIQDCIQPDPRQRPTMKEITFKLREVITISPDQATPRLSPLWWAELEILSVEAT
ncbi:hypothetical protein UlMin_018222 [Ulmus minor]